MVPMLVFNALEDLGGRRNVVDGPKRRTPIWPMHVLTSGVSFQLTNQEHLLLNRHRVKSLPV